MISAGILGGALTAALTSSSSELQERPSQVAAVSMGAPVATVVASVPVVAGAGVPGSRVLVYYVIDSEDQRRRIEMAVHSDMAYRDQQMMSYQPSTFRDYLWARTREEEAIARDFIYDLSVLPEEQDYQFRVVDLR